MYTILVVTDLKLKLWYVKQENISTCVLSFDDQNQYRLKRCKAHVFNIAIHIVTIASMKAEAQDSHVNYHKKRACMHVFLY